MPRFIADLEIHSKHARAVSPQMTLENLALWAQKKGIQVIGTGDFTHPIWFYDIKTKLEPAEAGLYQLKKEFCIENTAPFDSRNTRFLLSGEISCVYTKNGGGRRVHHLIYAPSIEIAEKINDQLSLIGNIRSDGRPIIGIDSKELFKILLDASPDCALIPAHIWTPWFGMLGSKSGFDSLRECFDEFEPQIFAIETGLSADPRMCSRVPFLDNKAIISSSDSHSLTRIGREATIFDCELSYQEIFDAMRTRDKRLVATVEFFPEEGRYHYDGHAACKVSWSPEETKKHNGLCSQCGKQVTVGVMARVDELADPVRPAGFKPSWAKPFYSFVPFDQIIGETLGIGPASKKVWGAYDDATRTFGSEFKILMDATEAELRAGLPPLVAEGVMRMRAGKVHIEPGYDGEYGEIEIFKDTERKVITEQKALF